MRANRKFLYISALLVIAILFIFYWSSRPKLDYTITELRQVAEPLFNLSAEVMGDSVEVEAVFLDLAGSPPKASLKTEGSTLKIIFTQNVAVSQLSHYSFQGKIRNLKAGKYTLLLLEPVAECLYEGEVEWKRCSKLEARGIAKTRGTFLTIGEADLEVF